MNKKQKSHHHHQSHDHHHHHHHHHSHGGAVGRMKLALALNFSFACIELVGGIYTNSVAILSDALHDFGDAIAVGFAIFLETLSHKKSDHSYSYGYRRFSTLGAVITGLVLIAGSVFILIAAIPRLLNPQQPHTDGMIVLAILGVIVNGFAAFRVSKGVSLNERMIMWHMIEDVLGWTLVLIGAVIMKFFNLPQLDAGLAIVLAFWILYNVFKNLGAALKVFLMATPGHIPMAEVEAAIVKLDKVEGVHHGHLWSLDGETHIYTAHVVLNSGSSIADMENVKHEVKKLVEGYRIVEATIETELSGMPCRDPEHL
ncbi:MAG: cation diffusion facilitator family transporter [Pseudobdellovibrionaceae bacterium]